MAVPSFARRLFERWMRFRQWWLDKVLTGLYGQKVRVLPASHLAVAGVMVLWMIQDGSLRVVMLRKRGSERTNMVGGIGLGQHKDMAEATRAVATTQLGSVFARTLKLEKHLTLDRVAAAPMLTYIDRANGIETPLQALVWVMQIQPVQLELLRLEPDTELMVVSARQLAQGDYPGAVFTHLALWRSIARHMPKRAFYNDDDFVTSEERLAELESDSVPRMLH